MSEAWQPTPEYFYSLGTLRRQDEMAYRREGRFDKAVETQRMADIFQQGKDAWSHLPSWYDRGALAPPILWEQDGLLFVAAPQSGFVFPLTEDMASSLLAGLHEYFSIRSAPMSIMQAAEQVAAWVLGQEKKP